MVYVLAVIVGIGVIVSILTGLVGLVITVPAALALLLVLRSRQSETKVDPHHLGAPEPDGVGGRDDPTAANPH